MDAAVYSLLHVVADSSWNEEEGSGKGQIDKTSKGNAAAGQRVEPKRSGSSQEGDGKRKGTEKLESKEEATRRKNSEGAVWSLGKGRNRREEMMRAKVREHEALSSAATARLAAEKRRKAEEAQKSEEAQRKKAQVDEASKGPDSSSLGGEEDGDVLGSLTSLALKRPLVTVMAIDSLLSILTVTKPSP